MEKRKKLCTYGRMLRVYKRRNGQISALEAPMFFGGVKLDPRNEWVRLAELTPWDFVEEQYAGSFEGMATGNPAKPARMAIGTLIVKERYRFSDDDILAEIRMNPYLQYYIGMPEFSHEAPFDASTISRFRKRVTPEMLTKINDIVIERTGHRDNNTENPPEGPPPTGGEGTETGEAAKEEGNPRNKGTIILDATCTPQNIRYPTDISLLNEAREKLEKLIDTAHKAGYTEGEKPRTYRKRARWDFLRFVRNRKPTKGFLRKSLRKQLGYVARDIGHLGKILHDHPEALNERQTESFHVIQTLYDQQREMYDQQTHRVNDRIVSLSQPHVRPIVRGKTAAPVEFGAKIEVSLVDRYARIEKLSWDAFNEGGTLQESVERFKADTGRYPERILGDKLFRTRENIAYCKEHGIRMNGPKLGRPPKDPILRREQHEIERKESGERSLIECTFGVGKRRYTLGCITTRLKHTSEVSIHVSILTMNLFRKLRLSFVLFFRQLQMAFFPAFRFPFRFLNDAFRIRFLCCLLCRRPYNIEKVKGSKASGLSRA